jgi:DNA-binding CsgD family transcriptional regulator
MGSARRRHVAALLATAVTGTGLRRRGDALRVARWQLTAGRPVECSLAVRAAAEALRCFDGVLAEQLARAALGCGGADDVEAMHLLGRALLLQNRSREAERVLARATAAAHTDTELTAVVLTRAQNHFYGDRDPDRAAKVLRDGIARVREDAAVALVAEAALYEGAVEDLAGALALCRTVLADPRVPDLTRLRTLVLHTLATSLDGRFAETWRWIDEGARLARHLDHVLPLAPYQVAMNRATALWGSGRAAEAADELERALDRAAEDGGPVGSLSTRRGLLQLEQGNLTGAHRTLEEAAVHLRALDPLGALPMTTGVRAWVLAQLGRSGEAAQSLAALAAERPVLDARAAVFASCARSWLAGGAGDLAEAGRLARAAGDRATASAYGWLGAVVLHQAVRLGAAEAVVDALLASAVRVGEGLVPVMADHARGLVEGDSQVVGAAARRFCRMGSRLAAAEAYAQAAAMDWGRGDVIAARRGATLSRLLERRCSGAATPALNARPAPISDRESDIAVLACQGLSSRDIAARLFLSSRTVDNHLGAAYRRLGVAGRDELGALLAPLLRR